jgi:hypothetical protein
VLKRNRFPEDDPFEAESPPASYGFSFSPPFSEIGAAGLEPACRISGKAGKHGKRPLKLKKKQDRMKDEQVNAGTVLPRKLEG